MYCLGLNSDLCRFSNVSLIPTPSLCFMDLGAYWKPKRKSSTRKLYTDKILIFRVQHVFSQFLALHNILINCNSCCAYFKVKRQKVNHLKYWVTKYKIKNEDHPGKRHLHDFSFSSHFFFQNFKFAPPFFPLITFGNTFPATSE